MDEQRPCSSRMTRPEPAVPFGRSLSTTAPSTTITPKLTAVRCIHIIRHVNASARHLTVRNVPPQLAKALEAECKRRGASLNRTVLDLLGRALGTAAEGNGLEALAGTWSRANLAAFERATAVAERIDEELWK